MSANTMQTFRASQVRRRALRATVLAAFAAAVTACGGGGGGGPYQPTPDPEVTTIESLELDREFGLSGEEVTVSWSISNPGSLTGRPHCRLTSRYEGEDIHDHGLVDCVGSHTEQLAFPVASDYVRFAVETVDIAPPNDVLVEFVTVHRLREATLGTFATYGRSDHVNFEAVAVGADGSVVAAGLSYDPLLGDYLGEGDVFVVKESGGGTTVWDDQFGSNGFDMATDVAVDPAGNVYVVGYLYGELGGAVRDRSDGFIRRYASDGTVSWTQVLGSEGDDWDMSVVVLPDGGAVVVGNTNLEEPDIGETQAIQYFRYAPDGEELWSGWFGWVDGTQGGAAAAAADSAGNVYVGGFYLLPASPVVQTLLLKLDPAGTVVWSSYSSDAYEGDPVSASITVDGAGEVLYAVDRFSLRPDHGDGALFESRIHKYSADGQLTWSRQVADYETYSGRYVPTVLGFGPGGAWLYSAGAEVGGEVVPIIGSLESDGQLAWIMNASSHQGGYTLQVLDVAYHPDGSFVLAGMADVTASTPDPVEASGFVWHLSR